MNMMHIEHRQVVIMVGKLTVNKILGMAPGEVLAATSIVVLGDMMMLI